MAEMQRLQPLWADMDLAMSMLCAAHVCAQGSDLSGHKARRWGLAPGGQNQMKKMTLRTCTTYRKEVELTPRETPVPQNQFSPFDILV